VQHLSAAGEGVSTVYRLTPQPLFLRNVIFFSKTQFSVKKHGVGTVKFQRVRPERNIIAAPQQTPSQHIWLSTGTPPRLGPNFPAPWQNSDFSEDESKGRMIHFSDSRLIFLSHTTIQQAILAKAG